MTHLLQSQLSRNTVPLQEVCKWNWSVITDKIPFLSKWRTAISLRFLDSVIVWSSLRADPLSHSLKRLLHAGHTVGQLPLRISKLDVYISHLVVMLWGNALKSVNVLFFFRTTRYSAETSIAYRRIRMFEVESIEKGSVTIQHLTARTVTWRLFQRQCSWKPVF